MQLLSARWVFPVSQPPIENGILAIDGPHIIGVYPKGFATPDRDFGNAAILPGLINAHTHLDLTGARGLIPPVKKFTDWLSQVIGYRMKRSPEEIAHDITTGLDECQRFGVTLVGDIVAAGSPLPVTDHAIRQVRFHELIGLSPERFDGRLATVPQSSDTDFVHQRLSLHAPYSVNHAKALQLLNADASGSFKTLIAMHLAESPGEIELLTSKSGPFVNFLERMGLWQPEHLSATLDDFTSALTNHLIVHGNFLDPSMLTSRHTVCYCPRTHAAFGHPPYPLREFLARGATICLGTDSLASNPNLDILAEARFVREQYPDIDGATILAMITRNGARALGFDSLIGTLDATKRADFTVIELPEFNSRPHHLVFFSDPHRPRVSFVDGIERIAKSP